MSWLEKVGIISRARRDQIAAYQKIEESGGLAVLIDYADYLRKQGDEAALVYEYRFRTSSHVMVELRYELKEWYGGQMFLSRGVALEATSSTPVCTRFTGNNGWDYLNNTWMPAREYILRCLLRVPDLSPEEIAELDRTDQDSSPETRIALAMRLAIPGKDFRYGEKHPERRQLSKQTHLIF